MTLDQAVLDPAKRFTLQQVIDYARSGAIGEDTLANYQHAWQTGATRFGRRVCQCDSCKTLYPSPEY